MGGVVCPSIQSRVERERSTSAADWRLPKISIFLACFLFPTLLPRQIARTLRMLLVVATVVTGSRSIQLSSKGRGRRHSSNFRYLANRPPHIFDSGLARNRYVRAFRLCFNEHPTFICLSSLSQTIKLLRRLCEKAHYIDA